MWRGLGSSDAVSFAGAWPVPPGELTLPGSGLRLAWARPQSCPRCSAENTMGDACLCPRNFSNHLHAYKSELLCYICGEISKQLPASSKTLHVQKLLRVSSTLSPERFSYYSFIHSFLSKICLNALGGSLNAFNLKSSS